MSEWRGHRHQHSHPSIPHDHPDMPCDMDDHLVDEEDIETTASSEEEDEG